MRLKLIAIFVLALGAGVLAWQLANGPSAPQRAVPEKDYRLVSVQVQASAPDFTLKDSAGRARSMADYRGRVVVIFFGFVRCPDACPTELFKLAQVMKKLGPTADRVQVLFISLDPGRDTPDILKTYVTAFDRRFVGLTGSEDKIKTAAKSFYVVYAKHFVGSDYTIDHSTGTFVISPDGRQMLFANMEVNADDFVHDIGLLARQ